MGKLTIAAAKSIAGSLGYPSKMPGTSYGLPAKACILGSKLAKIPSTVCGSCYALSNSASYLRGNAAIGQSRRLKGLDHPLWVEAMITLLRFEHSKPRIKVDLGQVGVRLQKVGLSRFRWNEPGYHRWHDSGDLQSVGHLEAICRVAVATPRIRHWLPTQELGMVMAYLDQGGTIPTNLLIRVSSIKVNDRHRRAWRHTSSVHTHEPPADAYACPAPRQGRVCGSCRACWSADVLHVAYEKH